MIDLDVRHTEQYGRGLYTRKSISCGVEVLREDPFVHVLARSQQGARCDWCLVESQSHSRCTRCKSTWYCGIYCQRKDWLLHKAECKGIAAIQPHVPTDTMRLVARALQKKRGMRAGAQWDVESLSSVKDSVDMEVKEKVAEQLLGVKALLREEFDSQLSYDVMFKFLCNTFNISDDELTSIGAGIYIQSSVLNHSCEPNCVVMFAGSTLTIRTVKDIPAGDQLFISYVDLVDSCVRRRALLKSVYGFVCLCGRCLKEERGEEETGSIMKELDYRQTLKEAKDWEGILRCHQLSPHSGLVMATKEAELTYEAQIGLGMWAPAAQTASKLVNLYRKCLFPYHPLIGLTLMKLGKLQRLERDTVKASISSLSQAVECLSISHGPTHPLTQQAREMLANSGLELRNS